MSQQNSTGWVHGLLLFVALSWGLNNIMMKLGFEHLTPQQFGGIRMAIALPFLIFLAGFLPGRTPFSRRDFLHIAGIGVIGMGLFQTLFPLGVHYTSAPVGGILMATMPVQVVIISLIFRIERPGVRAVAGVLLTVAGLIVLTLASSSGVNAGETTAIGVFYLVTAELGYAVHTTFLKKYMRTYSSLQVTGLAMTVSVLVYFGVFASHMRAIDFKELSVNAWGFTVYSGLIPLFVSNVLWNISVKHIGSTKVSVYGNLPPVFVLIFSAVIFGDLLRPLQAAGAIIILAGVWMVQLRKPQ